MTLEVVAQVGVGDEEIVNAVRDLYFVDPLELTLERCEHATCFARASVP